MDETDLLRMFNGWNPAAETEFPWTDTNDQAGNLLIIYSIAVGMKATKALEIGTSDGTSTIALALAMKKTGGHLITVDDAECQAALAALRNLGLTSHCTMLNVNSHYLGKFQDQFDLVLLDGDHCYSGSRADLRTFGPQIRDDGILLFHDCRMSRVADEPGCEKTALEILTGGEWGGVVLPFSANLGIFQRQKRVVAEMVESQRYIERYLEKEKLAATEPQRTTLSTALGPVEVRQPPTEGT